MRQFAEVCDIRTYGATEVTKVEFIVVAGIDDNRVFVKDGFTELFRRQVCSGCFVRIEVVSPKVQGHDFLTMTDKHLLEGMTVRFIDFIGDVVEACVCIHMLDIRLRLFNGSGNRTVDAFCGDQNSSF
ncbi:hypothetical protein SDC9_137638 [bioreactor metagenome]|uniref:Uncharacterized protein n=1 Tax=bioreactor metagenome TaxID=1076179 RepID=A0A645DMI3_9ZZZZ